MSKDKKKKDDQKINNESKRFAKQSVKKARKAYKKFSETSSKAAKLTQAILPANSKEFNDKVRTFNDANISELFDLVESMVRSKSVEDALIIQNEYMRAQTTKFHEQSVELGNALKKAFTEIVPRS
jgi:hypothetical protein